MPKITFLEATEPKLPLTKTIRKTATGFEFESYPKKVAKFNSHTIDVKDIIEFAKVLNERITSGMCLLKGLINKKLENESRAGSTETRDKTEWVCFDLDKAPFKTPDEFMKAVNLHDVTYVVQYSSSYGLPGNDALSCHIFCMLDKPMIAPILKDWLRYLNLNTEELRDALTLSDMRHTLKWKLDITCCQNDKLLYVCAPTFVGMKDPIKPSERVQFVKKARSVLNTERVAVHSPEALNKIVRELVNEKRVAMQLPKLSAKTVIIGEYEVQNKPGEMVITEGPRYERGFVYFNVNGGKNWSYYHPEGNYELIHNFKEEPCVRTKDVFPDYYKDCVKKAAEANSRPTEGGDQLLAFRDCHTASYWHGTYNEEARTVRLFPAKSELQIEHFLLSHDRNPLPFIPLHARIFDPTSDVVFDTDAMPYPTVNLYMPSDYVRNARKLKEPNLGGCPTIARIIRHVIGDGDILEHFYNWLAVIFQHHTKPGTAWVLHGVQGTGKDTLVDRILTPLFGKAWVATRNQTELNSDFTGWLEYAIIAHIREIEIDSLENGKAVESKIKNYITDVTVPIRKMRTDSYEAKNFTGFIFSSNKSQPVRISEDDRRFNVGVFQTKKLTVTIQEMEVTIEEELEAFANYLNSRSADRKQAMVPLRTQDRESIIALSMTSADHVARYLRDGNLEGLWESMPDEKTIEELYGMTSLATLANAYAGLMKRFLKDYIEKRPSRATREELGMVFQYCIGNVPNATPNKLTQYLAHHGLITSKMRIHDRLQMGVEIEWFASEEFLQEVAVAPTKESNVVKPIDIKRRRKA